MSEKTIDCMTGDKVQLSTVAELGWTKPGCQFKGWSVSDGALEPDYIDGDVVQPYADMTLYGIWRREHELLHFIVVESAGTDSTGQGTIYLNSKYGNTPMLEMKVDDAEFWQPVMFSGEYPSTRATLQYPSKTGTVIWLRASSPNQTLYGCQFEFRDKMFCRGNIMSLLDPAMSQMTVPANCFGDGFGAGGGLFSGCTTLLEAPEFPATVLGENCYSNMLSGCSALKKITVGFKSWETSSGATFTYNWMQGVPNDADTTRTFICSSKLPIPEITARNESNVLSNWTIQATYD